MSHQECVTTYFTRKRKRDALEPSKRRSVSEEKRTKKKVVLNKIVTEPKKAVKIKARPIKEYFSSSKNENKSTTAATKISVPIFNVEAKTLNFCEETSLSSKKEIKLSHDTEISSHLEVELCDAGNSSEVQSSSSAKDKNILDTTSFTGTVPSSVTTEPKKKVKVSKSVESVANFKPEEVPIQDVLKNKGKLKDLQDTLLKIKQLKEKTSQLHTKNEAKAKLLKSDEKSEYAFAKYHSLAQTIPKGLVLPYNYKILKDMFLNLDTVVSMLFNRQETVTWAKVHTSVKEMLKKNFELNHLAQIKHVFPEAYEYRQETNIVCFADPSKRSRYQLTLHPILESSTSKISDKMNGTVLIKRRHHFHVQLLNIVKKHHQKFLCDLDPPIQAKDHELRRWHPQFPLDLTPDVPAAELPSPPHQGHLQCVSAKEVFEKARNRLTQKAANALHKVASLSQTSSSSSSDANNNSQESVQDLLLSPSLVGVPESLLRKIRLKEAEKKSRLMLRSEEDIEKLNQLKRLPDVARALRSLFVGEKKASLPLKHMSLKLSKSCPLVCTADSMDKHLRLLSEQIPTWFNVSSVREQEYGRIVNKHMPISDVLEQINECVKKAESV